MPILNSSYSPPKLFRNGHISTIYPNLFRTITGVTQKRERIELEDGDFIDIDWSHANAKSKNLTILIHGLEGNGQRQYIVGAAKHLNNNDWDTAAINLRNCSGEVNRLYKSYNAGATEDLDAVITHIINNYGYTAISICGFSLGANIVLKYLGEQRTIPEQVKSGIAISAPCDLYDSLLALEKPENYFYKRMFIGHLKTKLYERQLAFPHQLHLSDIKACKSFIDIDDLYTSKAHGYANAIDYYTQCSSLQFLKHIKTPTLIINAKNDSFLGDQCYPIQEASHNPNLFLEMPDYGGHVGFLLPNNLYYNERRTLHFAKTHI